MQKKKIKYTHTQITSLVSEEEEEAVPEIPGLDWNTDSPFFKEIAKERLPTKKVPFARPIPRSFEKAWLGQDAPPTTPAEKGKEDEKTRINQVL